MPLPRACHRVLLAALVTSAAACGGGETDGAPVDDASLDAAPDTSIDDTLADSGDEALIDSSADSSADTSSTDGDTCADAAICTPGEIETSVGTCPVAGQVKTRTCTSACRWGDFGPCVSPKGWSAIATPSTVGRERHSAVWTGTEMIVWGGQSTTSLYAVDGAAYALAADTWRTLPLPTIGGRHDHTAVWTGAHMIVWGGRGSGAPATAARNDGAAYDPVANTWTVLPASPLGGRERATAVWTGTEMIVWGGFDANSVTYYPDGAAYDPAAKKWRKLAASPLVGRHSHAAVWTGTKMVVFGGYAGACVGGYCADSAAYDPATDSWSTVMTPTMLDARIETASVDSGGLATFFGGFGPLISGHQDRDTGATYDPVAGTWKALAAPGDVTLANGRRYRHVGWYGGGRFWFWGGRSDGAGLVATGASYDFATASWTAMPTANAPAPREWATAVWTGAEAIVWGGSKRNDGRVFRP